MRKTTLAKLALTLLLTLILPFVTAAAPSIGWATQLDLTTLPDGGLGVPKDVFEKLTPERQEMVSAMLTELNLNRELFSVEDGLLLVQTKGIPLQYQAIASAWNGIGIRQRVTLDRNGPPYPGAFWWYEHYPTGQPETSIKANNYTIIRGPVRKQICESNEPVVMTLTSQDKFVLKNTWDVSGQLQKAMFQLAVSFSLDASVTLIGDTTWKCSVYPGNEGDIRYTWLERWVKQTYDEYYVEDWNEDGIWDQCWFRGKVTGNATEKYAAQFATTVRPITHPNPCPVCGWR